MLAIKIALELEKHPKALLALRHPVSTRATMLINATTVIETREPLRANPIRVRTKMIRQIVTWLILFHLLFEIWMEAPFVAAASHLLSQ